MNVEYLHFECRSEISNNVLYGEAAVFDQQIQLRPKKVESFASTAFNEVLNDPSHDVVALGVNHDIDVVLGRRSSGTLRLRTTGTGLAYEIDLPDTTAAHDLRESVGRGDIRGASIGFVRGERRHTTMTDGTVWTEHTSVKRIRDVSPAVNPAYDTTSAHLRAEQNDIDARSQLILIRTRVIGRARNANSKGNPR